MIIYFKECISKLYQRSYNNHCCYLVFHPFLVFVYVLFLFLILKLFVGFLARETMRTNTPKKVMWTYIYSSRLLMWSFWHGFSTNNNLFDKKKNHVMVTLDSRLLRYHFCWDTTVCSFVEKQNLCLSIFPREIEILSGSANWIDLVLAVDGSILDQNSYFGMGWSGPSRFSWTLNWSIHCQTSTSGSPYGVVRNIFRWTFWFTVL